MSFGLTSGRTEPCWDNIGGIKNLYFFKFQEYNYTQIIGTKGADVTSFPATTVFKYEPQNAEFTESVENDENGVRYSQSLTFNLIKQDLITQRELKLLSKIDLRYIIEGNSGKLRIGGLWNGARVTSKTTKSGDEKGSFNGYELTLEGLEEYPAAYIDSLDVVTGDRGFLLLEDGFSILLEDSGQIILE